MYDGERKAEIQIQIQIEIKIQRETQIQTEMQLQIFALSKILFVCSVKYGIISSGALMLG